MKHLTLFFAFAFFATAIFAQNGDKYFNDKD